MPSGPPELHEYWCNKDDEGVGDRAAWTHLASRGYKNRKGIIYHPDPNHQELPEDGKAIDYLCAEWDWAFEKTILHYTKDD